MGRKTLTITSWVAARRFAPGQVEVEIDKLRALLGAVEAPGWKVLVHMGATEVAGESRCASCWLLVNLGDSDESCLIMFIVNGSPLPLSSMIVHLVVDYGYLSAFNACRFLLPNLSSTKWLHWRPGRCEALAPGER